jgi:hypothetical protein
MIGSHFVRSTIDGDGRQYWSFQVKAPRLNAYGLWDGGTSISVDFDHKKQTTEIYKYTWSSGAPTNFQLLKRFKGEIIGEQELPRILQELGIEVESDV